jgi:hypothetical protein
MIRCFLIFCAIFSAFTALVRADYLEVRRSANLKETPEREATVLIKLAPPAYLELLEESQQNGYYHSRVPGGDSGWIYRTLVRRYPGEIPNDLLPEPDDTAAADPGPDIGGYNRGDWKHWIDADHDCQDTRQEVLIEESETEVSFKGGGRYKVESGQWTDPYSGQIYTDPGLLDIDHMVPLRNAHLSGGWNMSNDERQEYANDLGNENHLVAVYRSLNRSKADKGPDKWKPPLRESWCWYAASWEQIKQQWGLSMTVEEAEAVREMKATCP